MSLSILRGHGMSHVFYKIGQLNNYQNSRQFFQWLNIIFNQVDQIRLKEFGPDRTCAEWLLRNGATLRWVGCPNYLKNYNSLPSERTKCYISEVDGSNSSISHYGFLHFQGCKYVKKIVLHNCGYIENEALKQLAFVKDSLVALQVSNCGNITDVGITSLKELSNLQTLMLCNLTFVKDKQGLIDQLQDSLPNCDIRFDELHGTHDNKNMKCATKI